MSCRPHSLDTHDSSARLRAFLPLHPSRARLLISHDKRQRREKANARNRSKLICTRGGKSQGAGFTPTLLVTQTACWLSGDADKCRMSNPLVTVAVFTPFCTSPCGVTVRD
ncbi:hypothetical protein BaRGS_00028072 [Batillaria attramentaria]|uniref:Uncharacterized protein n=1 Tax=Batillaria attramentaria TaxID=370345 RepID=A0ABD0K110_9CAEN